ncbi:MAG: 50S ribosomal protein L29 [Moorellales bacterium]
MKAREIRDLTNEEIRQRLLDWKQELFNLRFQAATGQLDNPMRIRDLKRSIARAKTVLRERELERERKEA